jgi:hypothetical protein
MIGHEAKGSEKLEPEIDSVTDSHLPEREKPKHREVKEMRSVPDLVEIAHSQAGLSIGDSTNMARVGEEGFVLLHPSAAEERGIIMRPYGVYACEFDAFGKAEVSVLLDQASRDDIGNLLCCSCAFSKHSERMRDLQCEDPSFTSLSRKGHAASSRGSSSPLLHACLVRAVDQAPVR